MLSLVVDRDREGRVTYYYKNSLAPLRQSGPWRSQSETKHPKKE